METPITVPVEIPFVGDERRKNWAKIVTNVDETLASGWAYEGEFIAVGGIQDVPIGSVVLAYGEKGSRVNPQIEARVLTVNTDGTVSHHATAKGRAWARTLRDQIVQLLAPSDDAPPTRKDWDAALMGYSSSALEEELRRRSKHDDE